LVTVTWVGADDHRIGFRNTAIGQGANSALPIFALFLQKLNQDNEFNDITQARFKTPSTDVVEMMDCEVSKRDGFFERLLTNPEKKKANKRNGKKEKGFFKRLFGKKDKN
jgi:penicillin-binding protein 1A